MNSISDKIKKRYNRSVVFFELTEQMMGNGRMKDWRKLVCEQARGKVLEVGVGTGINFQYYPDDADITAIDFSERMLVKAKERALKLNKNINILQMDAQNMDFNDKTFDTIITTCVFCSVPDPIKGLLEIKRVCKKDGNIIMLEHVRSKKPVTGVMMDMLNPIVVRMIGANINRNTVENIKKAGLVVEVEQNLMFDIIKHIRCSK